MKNLTGPVQISLDGDMFCVLLGENLQEGVAGYLKSKEYTLAGTIVELVN